MSAQTDLAILRDNIRSTGLELPDSITKTLDHYHRVRDAINEFGDANDADPRIVTTPALAALDAGRDPAKDPATKLALTRWTLGSSFGIRLLDAVAQAALEAIRDQDDEFVTALNEVFVAIIDKLAASHEVLAPLGVQVALRDPLGKVANLGGHVVSARMAWTDAIDELTPIRRLYEAIVGHAPNRTDYGSVSDDLRDDILGNPAWWQEREDMASLFWGLLDAPTWEPGLACRAESDERLAALEAEREAQADHHEPPRERARIGSLASMF